MRRQGKNGDRRRAATALLASLVLHSLALVVITTDGSGSLESSRSASSNRAPQNISVRIIQAHRPVPPVETSMPAQASEQDKATETPSASVPPIASPGMIEEPIDIPLIHDSDRESSEDQTIPPNLPGNGDPVSGETIDPAPDHERISPLEPITPTYPRSARRRGIEGEVLVEALISATGSVISASVVHSSGNRRLEEAAVRAVTETPFTPGNPIGGPPERATRVRVVFRLQ